MMYRCARRVYRYPTNNASEGLQHNPGEVATCKMAIGLYKKVTESTSHLPKLTGPTSCTNTSRWCTCFGEEQEKAKIRKWWGTKMVKNRNGETGMLVVFM